MDVTVLFILLIAGVVIGILSGLLGIGGGTIMVSMFRLVFDFDALVCTATSLFAIVPTSISGAITHIKNKTCLPLTGLIVGIGGATTSSLGVYLASNSPSTFVMTAAALVLAYSAISMFSKVVKTSQVPAVLLACVNSKKRTSAKTQSIAPQLRSVDSHDKKSSLYQRDLVITFGIGTLAGLMSGYVGVGGGFLIVPLLISFTGMPMQKASGTSLIAVLILAIPGTITQGLLGNINYGAGLAVSLGAIPGAVIGAKLVRKLSEVRLRILFGCVLVVAAILLIVKEIGISS